jgi:branched-chain amino acid transport system substrate-binding protein
MKHTRRGTRLGRLWLISASAGSVLIAACGSSSSTASSTGNQAGHEPTATIVATAPTTGEFAEYGIRYVRGALLAAQYAAAHHMADITIKQENSQGDPATAVTIARNVISSGIHFIVDYDAYQVLLAAAPVAQRAGALLVAGTKVSNITSVGSWIWQGPDGSTALDAKNIVVVLKRLHAKTIAIAVDNDNDGPTGIPLIESDARAAGITVKTVQEWDPTATDFSPQINNIIHAHVDAVASFSVVTTGALFIKQARAAGLNVPMVDGSGWDTSQFFQLAGSNVKNVYCVTDFVPTEPSPIVRDLDQAYMAKYHQQPNNDVATGFDAVLVIADAMKIAGSASPTAVRAAMARVNLDGAEGSDLHFSSARLVEKSTLVVTASNGQWVESGG